MTNDQHARIAELEAELSELQRRHEGFIRAQITLLGDWVDRAEKAEAELERMRRGAQVRCHDDLCQATAQAAGETSDAGKPATSSCHPKEAGKTLGQIALDAYLAGDDAPCWERSAAAVREAVLDEAAKAMCGLCKRGKLPLEDRKQFGWYHKYLDGDYDRCLATDLHTFRASSSSPSEASPHDQGGSDASEFEQRVVKPMADAMKEVYREVANAGAEGRWVPDWDRDARVHYRMHLAMQKVLYPGFWDTLTDEQKAEALAYDGPEISGGTMSDELDKRVVEVMARAMCSINDIDPDQSMHEVDHQAADEPSWKIYEWRAREQYHAYLAMVKILHHDVPVTDEMVKWAADAFQEGSGSPVAGESSNPPHPDSQTASPAPEASCGLTEASR